MITISNPTISNLGKLVAAGVAALAICSTDVLASGTSNKQQASSPISAYQAAKPQKTTQKKAVSPASAYKANLPGSAEAEKALAFSIDQSMAKTMNAIQWTFGASAPGRPILNGNRYQLVNMAIEFSPSHQMGELMHHLEGKLKG